MRKIKERKGGRKEKKASQRRKEGKEREKEGRKKGEGKEHSEELTSLPPVSLSHRSQSKLDLIFNPKPPRDPSILSFTGKQCLDMNGMRINGLIKKTKPHPSVINQVAMAR